MKTLLIALLIPFFTFVVPDLCNAQFVDMHDFNGADGSFPPCTLTLSGTVLYGMTGQGGANGFGNIFSINTNGSSYTDIWDFDDTGTNGANPAGSLTVSGSVLFGMTKQGGTNGLGNVFSIHTDGSQYTDLLDFNNNEGAIGAFPFGFLTLSGGVLYGMTSGGAEFGDGNIFSINTNGTGFEDLFDFNGLNGASPIGSLTLSGSIMYGMTSAGGSNNDGVLFSINTNGTNYGVLLNFDSAHGTVPLGSLIINSGVLYGMTAEGGPSNAGLLFSFNPNTHTYVDLLNFNGGNGNQPHGDLILSNSLLCGMTEGGGINGDGLIFSIKTNGTSFTDLFDFNNATGFFPLNNLIVSGNTFYGTATQGGLNSDGTIFSFTPPCSFGLTIGSVVNILCSGSSTGSAKGNPSGGTSPFTYSWSNGTSTVSISQIAINLPANNYTLTATDKNGCTGTAKVTITAPAAVTVTTVLDSNTAVCINDGAATATGHGGTSPYTYSWSPGGNSNSLATGLSAGSYTVTVTDKNECSATATIAIGTVAAVTATEVVNSNSSECTNTGKATITPSGGRAPYTYSWSPGGSTTSIVTGLSAGTYTVTVKDKNGCNATVHVIITSPASLVSTATVTVNSSACGNTGSVKVTVSGGLIPYTYSWSPTANTTTTITGLSVGTYTVFVKDKNGCVSSSSATITAPSSLSANTIVNNNSSACGNTGNATVTASGGNTPYTYSWSPGGNSVSNVTSLSAGTYTITVKDKNACSLTVSVTITAPASFSASASSVNPSACSNNGSITITTNGGITPYTYVWNPSLSSSSSLTGLSSGTFTITVRDSSGCSKSLTSTIVKPIVPTVTVVLDSNSSPCKNNGSATATGHNGTSPYTYLWSPGGNSNAIATGLSAGTYTITLTDKGGCVATATVTIAQLAAVKGTATVAATSECANTGTASVTVSGGRAPYTYSWSPGGNTTSNVTGLSAGTYTVTVKDKNGCTGTVTAAITAPAALSVVSHSNTCVGVNNATLAVTASGGKTAYTYSWSPGGATTSNVTGLSNGTYTITVQDKNGCSATTTMVASCTSGTDMGNAPKPETKDCCPMNEIIVYPNPTNSRFTIAGLENGMFVEIYDYTGRKLGSQFSILNSPLTVDLSYQSNGIYLIRILNADGTLAGQKKVVKTN